MSRRFRVAALVVAVMAAGCAPTPLPEAGSAQASLYVARCGGCHVPYHPHTLAPKMWQFQMDRMDQKFRAAGRPVPSGDERAQLLDYLTRNAGG